MVAEDLADAAERTRLVVGALGRAIHAAHIEASPSLARAVQAEQNLYEQIERDFGLLTSAEAGSRMGTRARAARNMAPQARQDGRLLALRRGRRWEFPGFQFDGGGARPVIADLIDLGRHHDRTETGMIQWLVSPTTFLHGERPVDVIDEPERLLATARQDFSVQW